MRTKYILWIAFCIVSGVWYLGDPEAHRVDAAPGGSRQVEVRRDLAGPARENPAHTVER